MKRNGTKLTSAALLCAALLAGLPFFIACGGDSTESEIQVVQVQITDQGIEMPNPLPTGMTTFEVTNKGTREHSFGLTGPSGDLKLEEPLQPGETGSMEGVVLDAGTYRVYSPLDQGDAMQIALNVRPETEGGSS